MGKNDADAIFGTPLSHAISIYPFHFSSCSQPFTSFHEKNNADMLLS